MIFTEKNTRSCLLGHIYRIPAGGGPALNISLSIVKDFKNSDFKT